jgi:hypothetical protein
MLDREVSEMIARRGPEAFRTETLWPPRSVPLEEQFAADPPSYEAHGARRVREGRYARALRLSEHMVPFERCLAEWALTGGA